MHFAVGFAGAVLCLVILLDGFESIILPQRVTRRLRPASLFIRGGWRVWAAVACRIRKRPRRDAWLRYFGPLVLVLLLLAWAVGLVAAFAMIHWGMGSPMRTPEGQTGFLTDLYMSGTTFFTLGLGDVVPTTTATRLLAVLEAGTGFGFLAVCITYLPVFFQAFSLREIHITMLDARAGTPPTATELVRRHAHDWDELQRYLRDWERWAAELLESHLSFPVLAHFRSQHDNQSWLMALTAVLDACALLIVGMEGAPRRQARRTFAIARHAVVDLAQVFNAPPRPPEVDRLSPEDLAAIRARVGQAGACPRAGAETDRQLAVLRQLYEPYANALAATFMLQLPPWRPPEPVIDNWQKSAWEHASAEVLASLRLEDVESNGFW